MPSTSDLDALLGPEEPHATFHDAELLSIRVDYESDELFADWQLCVGNPDAPEQTDRERRRAGQLILRGLVFWALEPPSATSGQRGPLWLTADGPLSDAPSAAAKELARRLPPGVMAWYLYFSDLNAFAYVAANSAGFQWA